MANIHELIAKIEDESLRKDLEAEVKKLSKQKKFGLVFEEHLPECTPLYGVAIKKRSKVARNDKINETYTVIRIDGDNAVCSKGKGKEAEIIPISELVPVAEFGDPIYPCLQPIDSVCNAPDSDLWHTLIEADNYHALQLLEYLYAGKVDCIYIDPPYNTGAKDWKYNNDYVDSNDSYRHSKWLSMIQKRLKIAKKLLNPIDSVLIITIDEKEYHHLACLLEEMFPEARIQMISDVINRTGSTKKGMFARAEEYIFFVFIGNSEITLNLNDMLNPVETKKGTFQHLIRGGKHGLRPSNPNLFYPIYFNCDDGSFNSIGDYLEVSVDRASIPTPDNCFVVWPLTQDGVECTWGVSTETFMKKYEKGYISFGKWKKGDKTRWIGFLQSGTQQAVEDGLIEVLGRDSNGALILGESKKPTRAMSVWNQVSHDAGTYGSSLISKLMPGNKRFDYPKSLYTVRDTLGFIVANKLNALIVDFFAGSGTTMHAVNLLNAEDGGHRRCVMVTNNEISAEEEKSFIKQHPDCVKDNGIINRASNEFIEYQNKLGIARYVTWPRTVCSIEGHDVNGNPLKGNYIGSDIPMADGFKANAAFFKLGFLDKDAVAIGRQFKEMLPTLWMKAGAKGKCPDIDEDIRNYYIFPENRFAILNKESAFAEFAQKLKDTEEIETVFFVTDYEDNFCEMKKSIRIENSYQLYKDYLDNFRINTGRTR